ncbi:PTS lactose transporter subunit IIB [Lactobacillus sp. LC28-10]|uniref:PTS lactose transporter subunit IIB n=1 Tax=Secundilactobacillus angelensis TaxID=2722706 RepID=A0ABX1L2I5_9LACO|nr:PTS lactose transporter subunit IIB [Secundilactobacillus angelensis]NLR19644.1 PTS lactose transporter subunit IIB [Secundilactobacillus angelensis]
MTTVLIVCASGITSHLLQETAQRSTEAYHTDITFEATSFAAAKNDGLETADLVLVAPQVGCDYVSLKAINPRLEKIPDNIYAWVNGESLVKFAMTELDKNKVVG